MLYIPCPNCGKRDESEFTYGGENVKRPTDFENITHEEWAQYLFMKTNPKGEHKELWYHSSGCRKWFYVFRNTVSYKISSSSKI
mgnify:CR=1 FL=1